MAGRLSEIWCTDKSSWGPWRSADEFTECFADTVFGAGLPLLYIGLSLAAFGIKLRCRRDGYQYLVDSTVPELTSSTHAGEEDSSVEPTTPRTSSDLLVPLITVVNLAAFFFLGWTAISVSVREGHGFNHKIAYPVVGFISWVYSALLVLILRTGSRDRSNTIHLHLTWLHVVICVLTLIRLQSKILDRIRRGGHKVDDIAVLATLPVLSAIVAGIFLTNKRGCGILKASNGRDISPEPTASIYEAAYFSWLNPLVKLGAQRTLVPDDLWGLLPKDKAAAASRRFQEGIGLSLGLRITYAVRWKLARAIMFGLAQSIFSFSGPYFLKRLLTYVENPSSGPITLGYMYAVGLLVGGLLTTLCYGQALWIGRKMDIWVKAMIMTEVYNKALRRRDSAPSQKKDAADDDTTDGAGRNMDRGGASNGQIVNLMSVDAGKVSSLYAYVQDLVSAPVRVAIASVMLFELIGWSFAVGLVAQITLQPAITLLIRKLTSNQREASRHGDRRISRISEVIGAIKILKFFAWEDQFIKQIGEIREKELAAMRKRIINWATVVGVMSFVPLSTTVITLAMYTMVAKHPLTPAIAFTSLTLFVQLRAALSNIPIFLNWLMTCKVSIGRLQTFFDQGETQKYKESSIPSTPDDPVVGFVDGTFSWFSIVENGADACSEEETNAPVPFSLRDLNITFPTGKMTIVAGRTGSGKTSLIMALLGEMDCVSGRRFLPNADSINSETGYHNGVAYVAQAAWLQNATIRENILFGLPYDRERYDKVIFQCALRRDFEILEGGDMTEVGEKGITLSGGQKQRVSLARAVYSRASTVLLDDCLSAVDVHTGKHILEHCLMGDLMSMRTRILVTHHVGMCLKGAAHLVMLDRGKVIANGEVQEVVRSGVVPDEFLHENLENDETKPEKIEEIISTEDDIVHKAQEINKDKGKLVQEETRAEGSVKLSVYTGYLRETGSPLYVCMVMLLFIINQSTSVSQDVWIKMWSSEYEVKSIPGVISNIATYTASSIPAFATYTGDTFFNSATDSTLADYAMRNNTVVGAQVVKTSVNTTDDHHHVAYYLGMYALIGVGSIIVSIFNRIFAFTGSLRASRHMHEKLLRSVLHAPMRFFDTTPVGRITNRFAKDINAIDEEVNMSAVALMLQFFSLLSIIVIVASVTPLFLIAAVFIAAIYLHVGNVYLKSSRGLKRIESTARSPVFSHFAETINGVSTIRAYGVESRFKEDNMKKIDEANNPFLWLWGANRWLSVRTDTGGALVSSFAAAFILINLDSGMSAGLAGLSLTYALQFNDAILWIVRMYSMNEMAMNNVERVQEYMELESEGSMATKGSPPPAAWPEGGEIEVRDLVIRYSLSLPPVLNNVSFRVAPGERIGIVGRTGAGKSTLAVAFFRILEPVSGTIYIDGVDITKIGLKHLRSRLVIIPQDPVLFTGTIRSNLDPFGDHSDEELCAALRRVHLVTLDEQLHHGSRSSMAPNNNGTSENANPFLNLESPIAENGTNLSHGQRQLLSLARAMLIGGKVVIMDEATASVDLDTDASIQRTIREDFVGRGCTILTIAHRLRTIIDYDRVLVLDAGKVAQYDTPYNLIQQEGIFREMCQNSGREFASLTASAKKADDDRRT